MSTGNYVFTRGKEIFAPFRWICCRNGIEMVCDMEAVFGVGFGEE
jgi:hypothetical protein